MGIVQDQIPKNPRKILTSTSFEMGKSKMADLIRKMVLLDFFWRVIVFSSSSNSPI